MNDSYVLSAIAIMSCCTIFLRCAPFVLFKNKVPETILYLGKVLPSAIMAMLVVYCLKDISIFSGTHGIPEMMALFLVFMLHKWKHQSLLSICGGTICYMVLIQIV